MIVKQAAVVIPTMTQGPLINTLELDKDQVVSNLPLELINNMPPEPDPTVDGTTPTSEHTTGLTANQIANYKISLTVEITTE